MKVLTIVNDLGLGGTQRAAVNFSIAYVHHGYEVAILALHGGGPRKVSIDREPIRLFTGGSDDAEITQAVVAAQTWKPDLIHVHRAGFAERKFARAISNIGNRPGPPPVCIETNVFSRADYSRDRYMIDLHCHMSRWGLWKWTKWTEGLDPKPLGCVIPYPVDTDSFYPLERTDSLRVRNALRIPDDAIVFLRVGQPMCGKWSRKMFDAFFCVAQQANNVYLVTVGLPDAFQHRIARYPPAVKQRVVSLSMMRDDTSLREIYSIADVLLHTADIGESFGMVLAEAMLCELPVVTLSTPLRDNAQLEIVLHNQCGYVVNDVESLSAVMHVLRCDRDLRTKMGKRGRQHVVATFGVAPVMERLNFIVTNLLAATTRSERRKRIVESGIAEHVADDEIGHLLRTSTGRISRFVPIAMKIVHIPSAYRAYSAIKKLRRLWGVY